MTTKKSAIHDASLQQQHLQKGSNLPKDDVENESQNETKQLAVNSSQSAPLPNIPFKLPSSSIASSSSTENIDKAVRFWTHPSLSNVSSEDKLQYLRNRIGLTEGDIYSVWDRVVSQQGETTATSTAAIMAPQQPTVRNQYNLPQQQQLQRNGYDTQHNHQLSTLVSNPSAAAAAAAAAAAPMYSSSSSSPSWPPTYPLPPPPYGLEGGHNNNDNGASLALVPVWMTLGGLIGVAAAAVVRWLNGGDFCLFPPPQLNSSLIAPPQQQPQRQRLQNNSHITNYDEEDNNDDNDDPQFLPPDATNEESMGVSSAAAYVSATAVPPPTAKLPSQPPQQDNTWLAQQVQSLTQTLETHVRFQERLLQKLTASETTDRSMNLLRSNPTTTDATASNDNGTNNQKSQLLLMIWTKLVEIKVELANLPCLNTTTTTNGDQANPKDELLTRLQHTLDQLELCMGEWNTSSDAKSSLTNTSRQSTMKGGGEILSIETLSVIEEQQQQEGQNIHNAIVNEQEESEEISLLPQLPSLTNAIRTLADSNEASALRVGAQLLYLYVIHLLSNPHVPRYRKIYTANDSFAKVQQLHGGVDLLRAVGFVERDNHWEWQSEGHSTLNQDDMLTSRLREAAAALSILKTNGQLLQEPIQTTQTSELNKEGATGMDHDNDGHRKTLPSQPLLAPVTPASFRTSAASSSSTPPPPNGETHTLGQCHEISALSPLSFQTPEPASNNILSPPTTKKHPYFPPEESPPEQSPSSSSLPPFAPDHAGLNANAATFVSTSAKLNPPPQSMFSKNDQLLTTKETSKSVEQIAEAKTVESSEFVGNQEAAEGDNGTVYGKRLLFDTSTTTGSDSNNRDLAAT